MEHCWHDHDMEKLKYSEEKPVPVPLCEPGSSQHSLALCSVSHKMDINQLNIHYKKFTLLSCLSVHIFTHLMDWHKNVMMCTYLSHKMEYYMVYICSMFIWTDAVVVSLPVHCSSSTFCGINCWLLLLNFPWSFCCCGQNI